MAARKAERLMNLTIALLTTRTYLSRERLRGMVAGYAGCDDEAFERMFERDKDDLRELGVPIVTGSDSSYFGDEVGYRIPRGDFELPAVDFSADEMTVLALAAQAWQQAGVAATTSQALAKLRADGDDPDLARLSLDVPPVQAREPAFPVLWDATKARRVVAFRYRGSDEERLLEPWMLTARRGVWYVVGWDRTRAAPRMFRLSRIAGEPRLIGEPGAYSPPADLDRDALATRLGPQPPDASALVAIRGERAPGLRRRATLSGTVSTGAPPGYAAYLVPFASEGGFVGEIAQAGPDAIVLEPSDLADQVREHLAGLVDHLGREAR